MSDIRMRRAERARRQRGKSLVRKYAPVVLAAVVIAAALVGAASLYHPPLAKRYAHEHAAFALFVEGERVSFRSPAYDVQSVHDALHMHQSDPNDVIHVEGSFPGGIPDWTLARFFEQYGLAVHKGDVALDLHDGHNGTRWVDQGNHAWHVLLSKGSAGTRSPFEPVPGDYAVYVPRDGDQLLLSYGDPTSEELALEEQSIGEPVSNAM